MTSLVFEKLAQTLAAAEQWRIGVAGDFFRVAGCDWPVTVALYLGGREVGRMSGVQAGDYVRDVPFDQVHIINGATAQAVSVQIAGGGVGSDRVLGEVSVIEGGRARTLAGQAFGATFGATPAAGNYQFFQLWNPAGTGKRVVVQEITVLSDQTAVSQAVRLAFHAAAVGAVRAVNPRKLRAGPAPSCEVRELAQATPILAGGAMGFTWVSKGQVQPIVLKDPLIILPGEGLLFETTVAAVHVQVGAQWFEEQI